ncbi:MAG TPA: glycoside hydrolase family 3 N-terminal domain-containing protein [Spirochaetia bacterium]|nr:glycoside hydrolase family 3 N-terminal domain-containing protein [Spirochaetia bacterium]
MGALVVVFAGLAACAVPEPPAVSVPRLEAVMDWAVPLVAGALSDRQLAGQVLMVGIENDAEGRPLVAVDESTRAMLEEVGPGAAVLFGQTFASIEQVAALVRGIEEASGPRPIIATDYEGGLVSRLTATGGIPATRIPPASVVGAAMRAGAPETDPDSFALAEELGAVMGRELRALGVTMNFAPVADVDPRGGVGSIGRHGRTYGDDPDFVGRVAAAVVRGLQAEGVAAVVKHFPGHGRVEEDSHDGFAELDVALDDFRRFELPAFELALESAPLGIMTGHFTVPVLAQTDDPASLSPAVTRIAREGLGYDGLIVTDALNMRALSELAPETELVVRALEAGADMVLKPLNPLAARDAILAALDDQRLSRDSLVRSVARVFHAKRHLGIFGPEWVPLAPESVDVEYATDTLGSAGHREVVDRILARSGGRD